MVIIVNATVIVIFNVIVTVIVIVNLIVMIIDIAFVSVRWTWDPDDLEEDMEPFSIVETERCLTSSGPAKFDKSCDNK